MYLKFLKIIFITVLVFLLSVVPALASGGTVSADGVNVRQDAVTAVAEDSERAGFHAVVSVSRGGLNVREKPSTSARRLTVLHNGATVDAFNNDGSWINIRTSSGVTGYVSAEFVRVYVGERQKPEITADGQGVVAYAKQYLGAPYATRGTCPRRGFDCSGFVFTVYRNFDITLNRSSRGMTANGVEVSREELMPGDLIMFTNGGRNIGHVGIYIGDNHYIHSSTYGVGVVITDLNRRNSSRNFVTARRIL